MTISPRLSVRCYPDRKVVAARQPNGLEQVSMSLSLEMLETDDGLQRALNVLNEKTASWSLDPFTLDELRAITDG